MSYTPLTILIQEIKSELKNVEKELQINNEYLRIIVEDKVDEIDVEVRE